MKQNAASTDSRLDLNRLSVLTAAILLTYAFARLLDVGRSTLDWSLFGVIFSIPISLSGVIAFLAAGLAATGMGWLLETHPDPETTASPEHWLLPALTAFLIGILLYTLPNGAGWWLSFSLGGLLLLLIFISEYIVLDASDPRYPLASAGLAALSFALFLVLCAALEYANARLALILLIVFPAATLVALRVLHLRLNEWQWPWALGIGLVCAQLAAGLHYWPITPTQYGLVVLAPLYALTDLGVRVEEQTSMHRAALQSSLLMAAFGLAAFFAGR